MKAPLTRSIFTVTAVAVLLSFLSACNINPEKSPSFVKLRKRVENIEDTQKKSDNSIRAIYIDVGTLTEDVEATKGQVRKIKGTDPKVLAAALVRVDALGKEVATLKIAMANQKSEFDKTIATQKKELAKQVAQARSSAPKKASSASSSRRSSAKPTTIQARQAPSGFYYKVKLGDTIQKISSKYEISSAKICRANHLPLSATLLAGQQIYIPKG